MRWKLQDAENSLRKAKYENTRVWRTDKIIIDKWHFLEVFNNIWETERNKYRKQNLPKSSDFNKK